MYRGPMFSVFVLICRLDELLPHFNIIWRFQVLTSDSVLWDATPYSLVEIYRRFKGAYRLHHQGDE
jgi:hypothetical protein